MLKQSLAVDVVPGPFAVDAGSDYQGSYMPKSQWRSSDSDRDGDAVGVTDVLHRHFPSLLTPWLRWLVSSARGIGAD